MYSYVTPKRLLKKIKSVDRRESGNNGGSITRILNKRFESVFEENNGENPFFERDKGKYELEDIQNVKECVIREKKKRLNEFKAFGVDKVCNAALETRLMRS